jgi:hypothetical protein
MSPIGFYRPLVVLFIDQQRTTLKTEARFRFERHELTPYFCA